MSNSNNAEYLNHLVNGSSEPLPNPNSVNAQYLNYLVNGGELSDLPEPNSVIGELLKKLCENGGGGIPSDAEYFYIFNDVELPHLPLEIVEEYPYLFIRGDGTNFDLGCSKAPYYYTGSSINPVNDDNVQAWYRFSKGDSAWSFYKTDTGGWNLLGSSLIWTNTDIPTPTIDSSTIYMNGSLPTKWVRFKVNE